MVNAKNFLGYLYRNLYLFFQVNPSLALQIYRNRFKYFFANSQESRNKLDMQKHAIIRNFLLRNVFSTFDFSGTVNEQKKDVTSAKKLTIWVCWWQGEDALPELSRICIDSIKKYANGHPVQFISLNNVRDYITIPNSIQKNYETGKISLTFLSDFLRASLLSKYGGLWIDSTVLMTNTVKEEFFVNDFASCRTARKNNASPALYRWAGFILGSQGNAPVFEIFRNMFIKYFDKYNKICDYLLIDYFWDIIYTKNPDFKKFIDAEPIRNPDLHNLEPLLSQEFNAQIFQAMTKSTNMFKLSFKIPLQENTNGGKQTFWGYIQNHN